ncbi:hypothetical protein F3Y22_tig00117048pilonHSYRG00800 [Hibiscus syriacus]|uniref:C2H2-type domain-containing protein n=1 Tax=Hibiscus syriacus TaxID=106335 RepID=A0A6A2WAJ7_HIBSY|nr:hypothetical protein F3Y22_tig00117048pilonHSYRG00800 [Hibiscus syriacus]
MRILSCFSIASFAGGNSGSRRPPCSGGDGHRQPPLTVVRICKPTPNKAPITLKPISKPFYPKKLPIYLDLSDNRRILPRFLQGLWRRLSSTRGRMAFIATTMLLFGPVKEWKSRAVDYQPSSSAPSSSSSFNPSLSGQILRPHPEVRRELMAEREMAVQQRFRETGLSYEKSLTMRLDPRLPFVPHLHSLNRWRAFNLFPPALLPPPVVLPPPLTENLDYQVKDASEDKKNELIILPKPDPNRFLGAKWKTPPPAGTCELHQLLISSKVKQNDEWCCTICQISVSSEKTLAEHVGERGGAERYTEEKPADSLEMKCASTARDDMEKTPEVSNEKIKNEEDEQLIKTEGKAKWFPQKKSADFLEKHTPTAMDEMKKTRFSKKRKFKFWCEICSVGTHSGVVMKTHKTGKRHTRRLLEVGKRNIASLVTAITDTVTEPGRSNDA